MMRIILYLGKGGVGKTTIAAATAVRSAKMGKRTLVVSTDLAHSLADCLNIPLASHPKEISLNNIYRNAREGNFEVVIIDAAPTGETVRLLSMPDTFQWYVGRITSSAALNLARPLIKAVMPSAEILDAVQLLSERVKTLREVLSNPDISSYRPVVNPERMVIKETLRAETYLALFGYPIDAVICNRVIPPGNYQDTFMQELYQNQEKLRHQIHQTFAPLPIWEAPYYSQEILGVPQLAKLADAIFGNQDPTQVF